MADNKIPEDIRLIDRLILSDLEGLMEQAGKRAVAASHANIDARKAKASGNLDRSIKYEVVARPGSIETRVVSLAYGADVDQGQPPGNNTTASEILFWMNQKKVPAHKGQTRAEAAPVIASHIRVHGTEPKKIFEDALRDFEANFLPVIRERPVPNTIRRFS